MNKYDNNTKYCTRCGTKLYRDDEICPYCGLPTCLKQENPALGICAIVFSFFSGLVGLILAIIGLSTYQNKQNRTNCKAAIIIVVVELVLVIITVVALVLILSFIGEDISSITTYQ